MALIAGAVAPVAFIRTADERLDQDGFIPCALALLLWCRIRGRSQARGQSGGHSDVDESAHLFVILCWLLFPNVYDRREREEDGPLLRVRL